MVAVAWANQNVLRSPEFGQFRGQEDFEALVAISKFTRSFAVDLSGTLDWPFPVARTQDYSAPVLPKTVAQCLDERSQEIWAEGHSTVTVLCGGDADSVPVLAAILKYAPTPQQVVVRYTASGVARYPLLFNTILPSLGVVLNARDDGLLVGNISGVYVDGRTGDDWQAAYQDSYLDRLRGLINEGDLDDMLNHIARLGSHSSLHHDSAKAGLIRFAENAPFDVTDAWSLVVALFRCCTTQYDSYTGCITEPDPAHVWAQRRAVYDHPRFTAASAEVALAGKLPELEDESLSLRNYAFDFFNDADWRDNERPTRLYYLFNIGMFDTHFLALNGEPHRYTEFPVDGFGLDETPASWEQIEYWRDAHEVSPIQTSLGYFHADNLSVENRMKGAIEEFDSLPTLNPDNTLTWKQPNQVYVALTQAELQQAYGEVKHGVAVRSALLHVKAAQFRQMATPPTPAQLADFLFWI